MGQSKSAAWVKILSAATDMASSGLSLKVDGDDEPTPAKAKQIAPALSSDCVVRLWPEDGSDWTHRIERHNK